MTCAMTTLFLVPGKLLVQADPGLYHFINQGVLQVDNMDDGEEMKFADVCIRQQEGTNDTGAFMAVLCACHMLYSSFFSSDNCAA